MHCTVLCCTALHCTALHCTALHCTVLDCTAGCRSIRDLVGCGSLIEGSAPAPPTGSWHTPAKLYCILLQSTALHCTALHCTALHCIAIYCTALHCTAIYCTALHLSKLDGVATVVADLSLLTSPLILIHPTNLITRQNQDNFSPPLYLLNQYCDLKIFFKGN